MTLRVIFFSQRCGLFDCYFLPKGAIQIVQVAYLFVCLFFIVLAIQYLVCKSSMS